MAFRPIDLQISIPRSGEVNRVQNNQGSQFNQEFAQQQQIHLAKQKQKQVNESSRSENNNIGKHKQKQNQDSSDHDSNNEKENKNQNKSDEKMLFDSAKGRYIDINI